MDDLLLYLAAAASLGLGLHRFVAARHGGVTPAMRHAYGFACLLSAALVTVAPATVGLAHRAGLPSDLPDLLGDLLHCCSACQLDLLAAALALPLPAGPLRRSAPSRPPRPAPGRVRGPVRRQHVTAVAVIAVMLCLYAAARVGIVGGAERVPHSRDWLLGGYDLMLTGYMTACLTALAFRLADHGRPAAPGPNRTGPRLLLLATVLGLLWTAWGLDDVVDAARSGAQSSGEDVVSAVLGAGCVGLLVAAAAGVLLDRLRSGCADWCAAYRRYRALMPLWAALHRAFPEIALMPPGGLLPPLNARFALYRRVIEIHDARLLLRRHLDRESVARVRRAVQSGTTPPGRLEATVEAAVLAAALVQARSTVPCPGSAPDPASAPGFAPDPVPARGWTGTHAAPTGLDAEADWLGHVSRAFSLSADVAAIHGTLSGS